MPISYLEPWWEIEDLSLREGLQSQYDSEIGVEHPLWNTNGKVVGKSDANDDVLVALADGRYALVHLTWSSNAGGATWPDTVIFDTAEQASVAIAPDSHPTEES